MEVAGFTAANGISYNIDGSLQSLTYANGAAAVYGCDQNRRLDQLKVIVAGVERRFNRLIEVTKNGNIVVANYAYDPEGLRVVKKAKGETTHYVFQGTEPIFEKRISTGKIKSFVYALGKHLARVDGAIGDSNASKYWYVTDHLGSVRAVTDIDGKKVWSADYLAFGTQYGKDAATDFEELHSFTGKEYDPDTGLHYYNARWYDSELGRFISEDPVGDPNNPNLYVYCRNNPVVMLDPTGLLCPGYTSQEEGMAQHQANSSTPAAGPSAPFTIGGEPGTPGSTTITGTYDENGELSSVETITEEETRSPGVRKTTRTVLRFDEQGNKVAKFESITYSKKGHGKVTINTTIIGDDQFTYYYITDKDGNFMQCDVVTGISLVGLRGWGTGKETKSKNLEVNENETKDKYNDMIVLVNKKGQIASFHNCNFNSTNYKGKYSNDADALTGEYGDIADGYFVINYGYHRSYQALWVNNNNFVDSISYNPFHNAFIMNGIHIHKGGDDWSWSTGCITIHYSEWNSFMGYFESNRASYSVVRNSFGLITGMRPDYVNGNIKGTRDGQVAGELTITTI